jgi:uncharacterized protein YndB with AHSA1/START domain
VEARRVCWFRLTRRYGASPEEVWAALTEPESLARWLARPHRVELEPGGAFELDFNPERMAGRVREVEPARVLELDWRHADEQPSVVRIELASEAGGTRVVLEHRQVDEALGQGYAVGWTTHLDRLEGELS